MVSNGLARFDAGHWIVFRQKTELPPYQITCLLLDRQKSVWVGLDGHGAARWLGYDQWESLTTSNGLTSDVTWNFARDARGNLWLATESDLERLDRSSQKMTPQSSLNSGPMARIQTLAFTADGHLWSGSDNGKVIDYDPATRTATTVAQLNGVFQVLPDGNNRIWISSMAGLYSVTSSRGPRVVEHALPPGPQGKCYEGARDSKGNLWFIADSGLYRLTGSTWTHIRLPSDYQPTFSAQIALARDGTVWLSGSTAPLFQFRIHGDEGEELARWSTAQIGSSNVFLVAFDPRGWLWVGTDRGLTVLKDQQWHSLTVDDGLIWNDINSSAFLADTDGSIWIGTSEARRISCIRNNSSTMARCPCWSAMPALATGRSPPPRQRRFPGATIPSPRTCRRWISCAPTKPPSAITLKAWTRIGRTLPSTTSATRRSIRADTAWMWSQWMRLRDASQPHRTSRS